MLRDEPKQDWRLGFEMEMARKRNIGAKSNNNVVQVEDKSAGQSMDASILLNSSLDWNTFLGERYSLSEEEFSICFPKISRLEGFHFSNSMMGFMIQLLAKLLTGIMAEFYISPNIRRA
eukprot:jgi/Galph1/2515/GphlegSOOS_G1173.1